MDGGWRSAVNPAFAIEGHGNATFAAEFAANPLVAIEDIAAIGADDEHEENTNTFVTREVFGASWQACEAMLFLEGSRICYFLHVHVE